MRRSKNTVCKLKCINKVYYVTRTNLIDILRRATKCFLAISVLPYKGRDRRYKGRRILCNVQICTNDLRNTLPRPFHSTYILPLGIWYSIQGSDEIGTRSGGGGGFHSHYWTNQKALLRPLNKIQSFYNGISSHWPYRVYIHRMIR